jgi:AbrB family looped-hinge helix DNA binding protein
MRASVGSVSTKGQVTIPQEIREQLGISPGDRVWISVEDSRIVMRPADLSIRAGYGSIPSLGKRLTDDEITEIAAAEAVDDAIRDLRPTD